MTHKTAIDSYNGSLDELIEDIGNLRYDALSDFLEKLSEKISNDGAKDKARKRVKLATCLENCAVQLYKAKIEIDKAWKICKPFV